jgi:regulator of sigma E protease
LVNILPTFIKIYGILAVFSGYLLPFSETKSRMAVIYSMNLLAINWAETGVKAAQFVLSFSIIVVLHELGHFFPARWFKCRVEKFYLFFNPWFSLFKKKIGETEWGIGWIPFGGFVKISGMIDESMDKEQMKKPAEPHEFRSKPAWQRLIIMIGGVVVNLVLGFLIYAMMLWYWGDTYVPTNKLKYGIGVDSLGRSIGLKDGDQILSLDGKYVEKFRNIPLMVILNNIKTIEVDRNGEKLAVKIPDDFPGKLIKYKAISFVDMRFPFEGIDSVMPGLQAEKMGIRKGDKIVSYNGTPVSYFHDFRNFISDNRNKEIALTILRNTDTLQLKTIVPKNARLGFAPSEPKGKYFEEKHTDYSLGASFPAGFRKSIETLKSYWLQLKLIFSGKVNTNDSLGSVFSIGKMFSATWDWQQFWGLTAFFSLVLALMNILPIPALDGGHAMFTIYEMISGRKPSDKFIEYAQMVGMVLLLGLMVYALGLDVFRMFKS